MVPSVARLESLVLDSCVLANNALIVWQGVASPVVPHPSESPGGPLEGQSNSVTIAIADEHIGAVVGRGGRNIMEISQV